MLDPRASAHSISDQAELLISGIKACAISQPESNKKSHLFREAHSRGETNNAKAFR